MGEYRARPIGTAAIMMALAYVILSSNAFSLPSYDALPGEKKPSDDPQAQWAEIYMINSINSTNFEIIMTHQSTSGSKDPVTLYGGRLTAFGRAFEFKDLRIRYGFDGPKMAYGIIAPQDMAMVNLDLDRPLEKGEYTIFIEPAKGLSTRAKVKVENLSEGYHTIWP